MQLANAPGKLTLPFANGGGKNTIPVASQIGITPGAASLTDGFPPLTRTPLAAGGVPPSGLDMNGILYELSAILRWTNAGGGYVYDSTFTNDANVGGYPKGARILRSDGTGYWFNTTDGNTVDPEANAIAAIAAGWVPDFTNGVAAVAMTNSNVTLAPLQYGKPVIVISGALSTNLSLIFPTGVVGEWTVINNTTGPYAVTCKTSAGTGVAVNSAQLLVGDGVNIYNGNLDAVASLGANVGTAGGTADAITVTFGTNLRAWAQISGIPFWVRAGSVNATSTPTLAANGLAAMTIVKGANAQLVAGDIAGPGHWLLFQYDSTLGKVVLLNPATGVQPYATAAEAQAFTVTNKPISPATLAAAFGGGNQSLSASGYQKLPSGLIIQWGTATVSSGVASVTFPLTFSNAIVSAQTNPDGGFNSNAVEASQWGALTTSGMTVYGATSPTAGGAWSSVTGMQVKWFVVGY